MKQYGVKVVCVLGLMCGIGGCAMGVDEVGDHSDGLRSGIFTTATCNGIEMNPGDVCLDGSDTPDSPGGNYRLDVAWMYDLGQCDGNHGQSGEPDVDNFAYFDGYPIPGYCVGQWRASARFCDWAGNASCADIEFTWSNQSSHHLRLDVNDFRTCYQSEHPEDCVGAGEI